VPRRRGGAQPRTAAGHILAGAGGGHTQWLAASSLSPNKPSDNAQKKKRKQSRGASLLFQRFVRLNADLREGNGGERARPKPPANQITPPQAKGRTSRTQTRRAECTAQPRSKADKTLSSIYGSRAGGCKALRVEIIADAPLLSRCVYRRTCVYSEELREPPEAGAVRFLWFYLWGMGRHCRVAGGGGGKRAVMMWPTKQSDKKIETEKQQQKE
jgi:hypothetical protein